MRKLISIALVGLMLFTLFGFFGGVVKEAGGSATYDPDTNTIIVSGLSNTLITVYTDLLLANPGIFYWDSLQGIFSTNASIKINNGGTLSITYSITQQTLLFDYNSTRPLNLTVLGTLSVSGTESGLFRFDSNRTNPNRGDWDGMIFIGNEASNSVISYAKVNNASIGITIENSNPRIANCVISENLQYGVYIRNSAPIIIGNKIMNNGNGPAKGGLYIEDATLTIENCTVLNPLYKDLIIYGVTDLISLNSTFNNVDPSGGSWELTVKWYLHVLVTEEDGTTPISDASVYIENITGEPVFGSPFTSDANGRVQWIKVIEYIDDPLPGTIAHTPHNITITHNEYYTGYADPEPYLDSSKQVQVNLTMIRRDLTTNTENITFSPTGVPIAGEDLTVYAKIHNIEVDEAREVRVIIIDYAPEGPLEIYNNSIGKIEGNSYKNAIEIWQPTPGIHLINVSIDPYNEIKEKNSNPLIMAEENNNASITINVNALPWVNISEPAEQDEVIGIVNINGAAFDDHRDDGMSSNITRVDLRLVDYDWISFNIGPNLIYNPSLGVWVWQYDWDTTQWNGTSIPDGNYKLQAVSWDNYHFSQIYEVNITINNTGENEPPVAVINEPTTGTSFSANESIKFNGSLSSDPNNDPLTYEWDFDDGNFAYTNVTYHSFTEKRTFNVNLTVNDTQAENVTSVTVIIDNYPAYAEVTSSTDVALPNQTITFYGYNSTDAENPDSLTYFWDFNDSVDSDGDGNFTNDQDDVTYGEDKNSTYHYTEDGTYTVTLTVWDGRINSIASVTITIDPNEGPNAVINDPSPMDVYSVYEIIIFNASGSSDPNDDSLEYYWDFGDGNETGWIDEPITTHYYTNYGPNIFRYSVTLEVRDNEGEVGTDSVFVTVSNFPPVANASSNVTTSPTNQDITFDGSDSDDTETPSGSLQYLWDFDDGSTSDLQVTQHQFAQNGTYNVTLTVDDGLANDTDWIIITITNRDPKIINISISPEDPKKDEVIYFNITASDEDGQIVKFEWDFGSGYQDYTSTQGNTTHSFSSKEDYIVSVRITDDDNAISTKSIYVNITNSPPEITITDPEPNEDVSGIEIIKGNAWDIDGIVEEVRVSTDGIEWKTATDDSGNGSWWKWSFSWDTTEHYNGAHTVYARANDTESDSDPIASLSVNIQNQATSIEVTEYLNPKRVVTGDSVEVYGTVLYNTGEPVENAVVNVTIVNEEGNWINSTDSDGEYSITISAPDDPGGYWVKVKATKSSFAPVETQESLTVDPAPAEPDLEITTSDILFSPTNPFSGETVQITITVRNTGSGDATNVLVNAYDGDPDAGGGPISPDDSESISRVPADGTAYVYLNWDTSGLTGLHYVYVVLDPAGTITESDEENNKAFNAITISGTPDFKIDEDDIDFANKNPRMGDMVTILIKIHNLGTASGDVKYEVYDGDPDVAGVIIDSGEETISADDDVTVMVEWTPEEGGDHVIYVLLDPDDEVDESDEENNEADKGITVEEESEEDGVPALLIPILLILVVVVIVILLYLYLKGKGPQPEKELPMATVVKKGGAAKGSQAEKEGGEKETPMESHGGLRI
ncbi:MAG: PKD domain-containing protein [Methanomassiliicoccales archaeon]|nr:MAG: PKD domain-containing protein [Methanomassiliicoccales archaeon]